MKTKPLDRPLPPVYKFVIHQEFLRKLRWKERLQILFGYRLKIRLKMATMHHCGKFASVMDLEPTQEIEMPVIPHQD